VLRRCRDCTGLERLAPEINQQIEEFADLPEVVQAMQQQWQERWQELSEAIA
jgi:fructoselysine-6-P-deglycase FrlB-like protein